MAYGPCVFESALVCQLMGKAITSELCMKCGGCCRGFPFVEVSDADVAALERFTGLSGAEFTNSKRGSGTGRFMKFSEAGDCVFLKKSEAGYACSVYEARPGVCGTYPITAVQFVTCEETWKKHLGG